MSVQYFYDENGYYLRHPKRHTVRLPRRPAEYPFLQEMHEQLANLQERAARAGQTLCHCPQASLAASHQDNVGT